MTTQNPMRIAIDPGKSGAIAVMDWEQRIHVEAMPDTPLDIYEFLRATKNLATAEQAQVYANVEQVGLYFPSGNKDLDTKRIPGILKLREHLGVLRGFLIALRIPFSEVPSRVWMKRTVTRLPSGGSPASVRERKNRIKAVMQELYPDIRVTLENADALGILTHMVRNP